MSKAWPAMTAKSIRQNILFPSVGDMTHSPRRPSLPVGKAKPFCQQLQGFPAENWKLRHPTTMNLLTERPGRRLPRANARQTPSGHIVLEKITL
jgi:hypothetical protein